jgi:hypothetical protein
MPARVGPEESKNRDLKVSSADDDAVYAQQPLATASAIVQQPPHDQGNHTSVATAQQQTSTSHHHGGEHRGCKFPPIPGGREDLVLQLLTERRRAPNQVVNQPGFLTHAETMALVRLANMAYNTGVRAP